MKQRNAYIRISLNIPWKYITLISNMFDSRADVIELSKMQNDMIPDPDTNISIRFEENKAVIEGLGKIRRTQTFADMISQKVLQVITLLL